MISVGDNRFRTKLNPDLALHTAIVLGFTAAVSFASAELAGALALRPQMVWPLWPGCALLVGLLLLNPRRIWPLLMAAGLGAIAFYDRRSGLPLHSTTVLVASDAVEILIAALGISYLFDGAPRLDNVKSLAKYCLVAVILAPLASAFLASNVFGPNYWARWKIGFFTEALALLTLTPAILSWARAVEEWKPRRFVFYLEAATMIAGLIVLANIAFVAKGSSAPALLYSLLPFLLWSALRFGITGISTSMIVIAFLSIWGAVHGRGPFTGPDPLGNVLSLQLFLFCASTPFMVLAALVEQQKQTEQESRESELRFRLVADRAPVLIWMSDTDMLCSYFNKPWLEFTGRPLSMERGNGWTQGVHPDDLHRCMDIYTQSFARREHFRMEYRLLRHDSEYRWVFDTGVPRFKDDGTFTGYIGSCIDVTERKRTEDALRESEERFRLAAQAAEIFAYEWDAASDQVMYSAESFQILGVENPKIITGQQMLAQVHPEDRGKLLAASASLSADKPSLQTAYRVIRSDGSVIWLERTGRAYFGQQGEMLRVVGIVRDITERKRAEEALLSMSRRLIGAQEQERARIARELHDDMGQRLALVANELEQLQQAIPRLGLDVARRIRDLQKNTSQIATDVQSLSHELHSSKLEYLGLAVAMRSFCREFSQHKGVNIDYVAQNVPSVISPEVSLCLFRVMQEALQNAVKHSGAKHFKAELWGAANEIHLEVVDSGAGFDNNAPRLRQGLGLISMEERLKLVNGIFSIETQPGHGTRIHARAPLILTTDSLRATG
jgi:PAS domain S-box-containing protein